MPLLEDHTASFIVRIWRELGEASSDVGVWRGSIEYVPSGRRAFFRELTAIIPFMKPHLTELGIHTVERFWGLISDDALPDTTAIATDRTVSAPRSNTKRRKPLRT